MFGDLKLHRSTGCFHLGAGPEPTPAWMLLNQFKPMYALGGRAKATKLRWEKVYGSYQLLQAGDPTVISWCITTIIVVKCYIYISIHIHTNTSTHPHIHTSSHPFIHSNKQTNMHACMHACTHTRMHTYISYYIISHHIISYHIISYHILSYHIISYHTISYHIIHIHTQYIYIDTINIRKPQLTSIVMKQVSYRGEPTL